MIKRNSALALGGILAVAGCAGGGGGSASAPVAKPAQSGTRPLSTASFTINPTLLRHASSRRRRPAFVDTGGNSSFPPGSVAFFQISSRSADNVQAPMVTIPIPYEITTPIAISIPLYGPDGFIRIKEIFQPDSTVPATQFVLADTDAGGVSDINNITANNVRYSFMVGGTGGSSPITFSTNNGAFANALTLNAVAGGVVLSDTPDGSSGNTAFFPANPMSSTPLSIFVGTFVPSVFVYAFTADAAGGFTNVAVPGGFPKPPVLSSSQLLGQNPAMAASAVPGAFVLANTACSQIGTPTSTQVSFDATDVFGQGLSGIGTVVELDGGGYLNANGTCPTPPP